MSVPFSAQQEELRRYVRQWLDERAPLDEVRRITETADGFDRSQWRELGELGWPGIAIAEDHGGAGFGFMEVAVLAEEMGRTLYPSPFLSTVVIGAEMVAEAGDEEQRSRILGEVAKGDRRLAVAVSPFAQPRLTAADDGSGWRIDGTARFVLDGHTADTVIVEALVEGDRRLFLVDGGDVEAEPLSVMDLTRPQAELRLSAVAAEPLAGRLDAAADVSLRRAVAYLAMEQVGGAQACLDMSVEYAKSRYQFGRPIGSFQAIKHMCADMLVAVESARSIAYHLASVIDGDDDEAELMAPVAKSFCGDAYFQAAADTIQIHGGIGFTWEHNAHLFLKRAESTRLMFGDGPAHRARLARRLGLE